MHRYSYTLCKSCNEPETTEKQVFNFLEHFFPGIQYSKSSYMGGKFCPQVGVCLPRHVHCLGG